nr:hypothetical protein [Methanobacterium formicicum]
MNDPSLKIMNRSFGILNKRRSALLEDERTLDLKEKVKKIREYSVEHLSAFWKKHEKHWRTMG